MKGARLLLFVAVTTATAGCATLTEMRSPEQDAQVRLDRGLSALEGGEYAAAFDDLAWVYARCTGHEAAGHALLALAALELDPRNERARPAVGTDLLGRAITGTEAPRWVRPLAETSFLTALALGAPHPDPRPVRPEAEPGAAAMADSARAEPDHDPAHDHDPDEPATSAAEALAAPVATVGPATLEPAYGCGPVAPAWDTATAVLPELPGPSMAALLTRAESRRDSLSTATEVLKLEMATLREQLAATRAELERIRKTLKP